MEADQSMRMVLESMRSTLGNRVPVDMHSPFTRIARERLKIRTVDNRIIPFELRPIQKRYLAWKRRSRMLGKPPRYLLLKYRRGGFTTIEQGLSYDMAARNRNVTVLTIAQDGETTSRIFRIARLMHERDPDAPAVKGIGNQHKLEFGGLNSLFYVGTAAGRGVGRGDTLSRVHWSEVAWSCPGYNQNEKQRDILTGLTEAASHGEMVLETTPNGSEMFRELYVEARAGRNDWTPIFLPWFSDRNNIASVTDEDEARHIMSTMSDDEARLHETRGLDAGQVLWRRRKVRELKAVFPQEYPEDDESCWLISGTPFFDVKQLMWLRDYCTSPPMVDDPQLGQVPKGAKMVPGGYYVEWEEPRSDGVYVMGVDTSEGLPGRDPNGFGVMDRETGRQVAALHGIFNPRALADHVCRGSKRWNEALVGIERENHGHAVIQKVIDLGLHRSHLHGGALYHHSAARAASTEQEFARAGWTTNALTRPVMLERLRDWLDEEGALERVRDRQFLSECMTFRMQADGGFSHDPGCHDDALMKWAVCNMMRTVDWRRKTASVHRVTRYGAGRRKRRTTRFRGR